VKWKVVYTKSAQKMQKKTNIFGSNEKKPNFFEKLGFCVCVSPLKSWAFSLFVKYAVIVPKY